MAEAVVFSDAPEVSEIARRLCEEHHPHVLRHRLECIFRSRHQKKLRSQVWATARVVRGREAFLATSPDRRAEIADELGEDWPLDFFLIEVALDIWETLNDREKVALIDHELCHLTETDEDPPLPSSRGHDLEEFAAVVDRHGLWEPSLREFATSVDLAIQREVDDAIERA